MPHMHTMNRPLAPQPTFAELFTPKLVTVLKEGYGLKQLRADAVSGLTVAVVALPLSMAIAIASGVSPERGLYAAIVGGFFVSALGGSRFQIGGPAGAFIVLVAAALARHGLDGLLLATAISGVLLAAAGLLRLGTYIKFIPYPVTVGFTAGIAVIIFASQVKDLLGLKLDGAEPGPLIEKIPVLARALPSANPAAIAIAAGTIAAILLVRRFRPHWPAMLIAVAAASLASVALGLGAETIGTRFGHIPAALPAPHLPAISLSRVAAVLPDALAFTLLGAIESLLSAVVADGMTGRRHRSNCELVAQGVANLASSLVGGLVVTGTIARTATNVRAGAHGPVSGMAHALFVLLFMVLAAPLAVYVPLAALAGVLAVVAWNMAERHAFATLLRASRGDAAVLLATFLLTVFRDLSTGIVVGFALGSLLFIHRMSQAISVESEVPLAPEDAADTKGAERTPYEPAKASDPDILVYRIRGAFFFGAASAVGSVLERMSDAHRALVIDFAEVPFLDSTAASTVLGLARRAKARGVRTYIAGANQDVARELGVHGAAAAAIEFCAGIPEAVSAFRAARAATGAGIAARTQPSA